MWTGCAQAAGPQVCAGRFAVKIMKIRDLILALRSGEQRVISIVLPGGARVPAHYHITEVGHVSRRFIDCGGTRRTQETCLLQTWVHEDVEHRLHAGKLAEIFARAGDVLPHHDLEVEVEHELEVLAQFTLEGVTVERGSWSSCWGQSIRTALPAGFACRGSVLQRSCRSLKCRPLRPRDAVPGLVAADAFFK